MRKKIGLLIVAVLALSGLTLVSAPAATAAQPKLGTWSIVATCDQGNHHSKTTYNFTVTDPGVVEGGWKKFDIQLNYVIYKANINSSRGPRIQVQNNPPNGSWGGVTNTSPGEPFPFDGADAPQSGVTNGVNATWAPKRFGYGPSVGVNNRLVTTMWQMGTCTQYWDLAFPEQPIEEEHESSRECESPYSLHGRGIMDMKFEVTQLLDNNYSIELKWPEYHDYSASPPTDQPYWRYHHFDLVNGSDTISLDPEVAPDHPGTLPLEADQDGNGKATDWGFIGVGYTYDPVLFTYSAGAEPFVRWTATSSDGVTQCTQNWYLGEVYSNQADPTYTNTSIREFDDCATEPAAEGFVTVSSQWQTDGNNERVRPRKVTVTNNSQARIQLPVYTPGVAELQPRLISGDSAVTYNEFTAAWNSSKRIWAPGETRDLDISTASAWFDVQDGMPATHPYGNAFWVDTHPRFELTFDAFTPGGAGQWLPCNETSTELNEIYAESFRAP